MEAHRLPGWSLLHIYLHKWSEGCLRSPAAIFQPPEPVPPQTHSVSSVIYRRSPCGCLPGYFTFRILRFFLLCIHSGCSVLSSCTSSFSRNSVPSSLQPVSPARICNKNMEKTSRTLLICDLIFIGRAVHSFPPMWRQVPRYSCKTIPYFNEVLQILQYFYFYFHLKITTPAIQISIPNSFLH